MGQIWEYNGVQYEFDMMDADNAERYLKAMAVFEKEKDNCKKNDGLAELIRYMCNISREFFDTIFGSGESTKILGNRDNLRVCTEAYNSLFLFAKNQVKDDERLFNSIVEIFSDLDNQKNSRQNRAYNYMRSSPQPNREQRRRSKKKKK